MVKLRLTRGGAKKRPFYHLVATDSRSGRDGRFIERLGYFNPLAKGAEVTLNFNLERVDYWLGAGAQPSDRVKTLIGQSRKLVAEAAAAPAAEAPAAEAAGA